MAATIPILTAAVAVALFALYRWLLPRPIPGIPYNAEATRSIFGDVPALLSSGQEITEWLAVQARKHRSPMVQVWLDLFGPPLVMLVDFHEANDIMLRRKEFDRSEQMIAFFKGLVPEHHITKKTGPVFKAHRRLLQDLMTPSFLNKVAAPSIYASAKDLIALWHAKARISEGRPFSAADDVFHAAQDAVFAFTFGDAYPHRAVASQLEGISRVDAKASSGIDHDTPVEFPQEPLHEASQAIIDIVHSAREITTSPVPALSWWWLKSGSVHRRNAAIRDACLKEQVMLAVGRMQSATATAEDEGAAHAKSAMDLIVDRERRYAEKEGREPVYWSPAMRDEVFGLVVAGHDTTSTTLLWGIKYLSGNTEAQRKLRQALEAAHPVPLKEKRDPSAVEIAEATIPYLDAVMEEMLRLSATAPLLSRDAETDTTLLGHHIPKGTVVMILQAAATEATAYDVDMAKRSPSSQAAAKDGTIRQWEAKDVGAFKPERWLVPDADGGYTFDAMAGPNLAFGSGIRSCFGRRLAYLEMRLLVTLMIWNFEMQPCPEELSSFAAVDGVTHKPVKTYVRLRRTR